MHRSFSIAVLSGVVGALIASQPAQAYTLVVEANGGITELSIDANPPFHNTEATVSNATLIEVAGSTLLVVHWTETTAGGGSRPFYTFSYDGTNFVEARPTSYVIKLRYEEFDPVPVENIPQVDASLLSASWADLFVVQFVSQPLTEYRQAIELLGATVRSFLPNNAQIVELAGATPAELMDLPYVRSVFEFHPAYRIDDYIRDNLDCPSPLCTSVRYNIMLFEDDLSVKAGVAAGIGTIGGTVAVMPYTGPVLQAMLTKDQLLTVIHWDEVAFVDLWAPSVPFMDKVRVISGANYLKGMEGFQGEGVRGEAADTYLQTTHRAFQNRAPIMHGGQDQGSASYHGTPVYGILFADDPEAPEDTEGPIRGMLPKAQGIFSDYQLLKDFLPGDGVSREVNICQLVAADSDEWLACCDAVYCDSACCSAYSWPGPDGEPCCSDPIPPGDASICDPECCSQYTWPGTGEPCCDTDDACRDLAYPAQDVRLEAVFQSNSGGTQPSNGPSAYGYAVVPAEIDRILDTYDIIRCQAQGNDSTAAWNSALEAWAKNGVSVGGVRHVNRLDPDTHLWSMASYGPAPDGRIKPDLTHFIDQVYAPCWSGDSCNEGQYKNNFAGTSAATPIVCGHFGLFFQMWHLGIFTVCDGEGSNCIASGGPESVFASRPGLAYFEGDVDQHGKPVSLLRP